MKKLDSFLLNRFQRISDFFQIYFGIDNFRLAEISLLIHIIAEIFGSNLKFRLTGDTTSFLFRSILFSIISVIFVIILFITKNRSLGSGFKNINALRLSGTRRLFVLLLFFTIVDQSVSDYPNIIRFNNIFVFVWLIMFVYFLSCTPKSPRKSKFKKLMSKLKNSLKTSQGRSISPA